MAAEETVDSLVEQLSELPDDTQAELLRSLAEMRLGVLDFDTEI